MGCASILLKVKLYSIDNLITSAYEYNQPQTAKMRGCSNLSASAFRKAHLSHACCHATAGMYSSVLKLTPETFEFPCTIKVMKVLR